MSVTPITGYPDFSRLTDQEVARQFKVVWDALKGISSGEVELEGKIPDVSSLTATTKQLTLLLQALERKLAGRRILTTTPPLSGGGDLSADRTLGFKAPGGWLSKATAQTITFNSFVQLTFDTANEDNDGCCDTVNSKLVCKTAGVYRVIATVALANNLTGARYLAVGVPNTIYPAGSPLIYVGNNPTGDGGYNAITCSVEVRLAVNDFLTMNAYQSSGGSLTTISFLTRLGMRWVAA